MTMPYFKAFLIWMFLNVILGRSDSSNSASCLPLYESGLSGIRFNANGVIPVIHNAVAERYVFHGVVFSVREAALVASQPTALAPNGSYRQPVAPVAVQPADFDVGTAR